MSVHKERKNICMYKFTQTHTIYMYIYIYMGGKGKNELKYGKMLTIGEFG